MSPVDVQLLGSRRRRRLVSVGALLAPALDLGGRLLAPTLLAVQPWLLLAISPNDPHLLLAKVDPAAAAVAVVFAARVVRAWLIYAACCEQIGRIEVTGWIRRLLLSQRPAARSRRAAIGAVVVLPGMAGAVVAARSRLRCVEFAITMVASTIAGLAITLLAASRYRAQLHDAGQLVMAHPVKATGVILAAMALGRLRNHRRARRGDDVTVEAGAGRVGLVEP